MADQQESQDQNGQSQAPTPEQGSAPEAEPTAAPQQEAPESVPSASEQPKVSQEEPKAQAPVPEFMKKDKAQPPTQPEERIWALIAYVPLVALMSLVMKPESEFVKLHGRQGLLLVVIFFVAIFFYIIPFVGPVIMLLLHLMLIGIGLFSMYQAYIGNWWKIPVLGDIANVIPVDALTKVTRTAVMSEKVDEEKRQESGQQESSAVSEEAPVQANVSQEPSPKVTPESEKEPKVVEPQSSSPVPSQESPTIDSVVEPSGNTKQEGSNDQPSA